MKLNLNQRNKKLILIIGVVVLIEISGYGFFASLFRLIGSVS